MLETASVWFSAYPASIVTRSNQNILNFLGSEGLWKVFYRIGIRALHTGPMKRSGGIFEKEYTETVDGCFDRISLEIDSSFGTEKDYLEMTRTMEKYDAVVAGDIIPGHTGKGADFLLALRNYKEYPGMYDLIEVDEEDWGLLPLLTNEWESSNLTPEAVEKLYEKGYIPGALQRVLFLDPASPFKTTGWDATGEILGVDGKKRRWIYLHYFKSGQPTLNWLDPSHSAQIVISADIIKSIHALENKILRLDATPFLGIEKSSDKEITSWSEGHPLSLTSTFNIAFFIRKMGGFSFQELNLTLDSIDAFKEYGPDLSYDFITRPALQHAILMKNASFLKFMLDLMRTYKISPASLIHGMQNHDEITYELVHFIDHARDIFNYENELVTGKELRDRIVKEMHDNAFGCVSYNRLSGNGLCTTFTGLVATRLKISDIYQMTDEQKELVKKGHLLMAIFNAMQPGVFNLSGWDLVGALPLPESEIKSLLKDKDYRWINRGAYNLLNFDGASSIPQAQALYGPINKQVNDSNSFVRKLSKLLKIRKEYKIDVSEQFVLRTKNKACVAMLHKLPLEEESYEVTALNFGDDIISETIDLSNIFKNMCDCDVKNLITGKIDSEIKNSKMEIQLEPLEGKVLFFN